MTFSESFLQRRVSGQAISLATAGALAFSSALVVFAFFYGEGGSHYHQEYKNCPLHPEKYSIKLRSVQQQQYFKRWREGVCVYYIHDCRR